MKNDKYDADGFPPISSPTLTKDQVIEAIQRMVERWQNRRLVAVGSHAVERIRKQQ